MTLDVFQNYWYDTTHGSPKKQGLSGTFIKNIVKLSRLSTTNSLKFTRSLTKMYVCVFQRLTQSDARAHSSRFCNLVASLHHQFIQTHELIHRKYNKVGRVSSLLNLVDARAFPPKIERGGSCFNNTASGPPLCNCWQALVRREMNDLFIMGRGRSCTPHKSRNSHKSRKLP